MLDQLYTSWKCATISILRLNSVLPWKMLSSYNWSISLEKTTKELKLSVIIWTVVWLHLLIYYWLRLWDGRIAESICRGSSVWRCSIQLLPYANSTTWGAKTLIIWEIVGCFFNWSTKVLLCSLLVVWLGLLDSISDWSCSFRVWTCQVKALICGLHE